MVMIPNFSRTHLQTADGPIITEKISMVNIPNRQIPSIKVDVQ